FLRQLSPVVTIGGGRILDTRPTRHRRNDAGVNNFLETLERGNKEESLLALTEVSPQGLTCTETVSRTGWIKSEICTAASNLARTGRLRIVGDLNSPDFSLVPISAFAESLDAIRKAVNAFHSANPLLPGIPKQELRGRAGNLRAEIFESALEDLLKSRAIVISGDLVQRAGREIALSAEEARAKELIEKEFERAGLSVPSFAAVLEKLPVESKRAQKILQMLLREKVLIKVTDELIFHRAAVARS